MEVKKCITKEIDNLMIVETKLNKSFLECGSL